MINKNLKRLLTIFIIILITAISIIIFSKTKLQNNSNKIYADVNSSKPIVSILGDSISTFNGKSYRGNNLSGGYYPRSISLGKTVENDITNYTDTWWMQTINELGFKLGIDSSWSGSTINQYGYYTKDKSDTSRCYFNDENPNLKNSCFYNDDRINVLSINGTPDYIFIFGGTNDMNSSVTKIGNSIDTMDTTTLIGAYNTLIGKLKAKYPNAKLIAILPMKFNSISQENYDKYHQAFINIFNKNMIPWIDLSKVTNLNTYSSTYFIDGLHPNKDGAVLIKNAIVNAFNKTTKVTFYRNYNSSDKTNEIKTYKFGDFNQKFSNNGWARTGYTQLEWNNDQNATTKGYNTNSNVYDWWIQNNSNVKLHAIWQKNSYNISYDLASGTYGTNHPTSATYDKAFTVNTPSKSVTAKFVNSTGASANTSDKKQSYTFNGWTISGMDSVSHTYGSKTSTATSLTGIKDTTFKNLRSTSGTVKFKATWKPVTMTLPTITKSGYTCVWTTVNNGEIKTIKSGGTWTYTSATNRSFTAKCESNTPSGTPKMIVHAIDYGDATHGDTVLIESNGKYLLMDSGGYVNESAVPCYSYGCNFNKNIQVIKYLKKIGVRKLSFYMSHYDGDHFYNFKQIINYKENGEPYFTIENIYLPDISEMVKVYNSLTKEADNVTPICQNATSLDNASFLCRFKIKIASRISVKFDNPNSNFCKLANCITTSAYNSNVYFTDPSISYFHYDLFDKNTKTPRPINIINKPTYITKGSTIKIGNATLKVIYHNQKTDPSTYNVKFSQTNITGRLAAYANNISLVSMITAGSNKFLSAGDIQYETEQEILKSNINIKADLMKLSHHGLNTSNYLDFVTKVNPEYVFYQYGGESSYKNINKNGKLFDIEYVGLRTDCGVVENTLVGKNYRYCNGNGKDFNNNLNLNKITSVVSSKNINSTAEYGTIRYIFYGTSITREYIDRKSINVVFNRNDGSKDNLSQIYVTDYVEPYRFGYTYLDALKWENADKFGFANWVWNSNSKSSTCTTDKCALVGWSTDSNGKNIDYDIYYKVTNSWINTQVKKGKTLNLYAVYSPLYTYKLDNQSANSKGTLSISGVKNKGIYLESLETKMSTSTHQIVIPTKKGYKFGGYYTQKNGKGTLLINAKGFITSNFTISKYSKNLTLYAKWRPVSYTITYNLNGGTVASANKTSYNVETATFKLNNPSKIGYTFTGWTGSNGSTKQTSVSITKGSTGNKTYTANWTETSATLSYNANGHGTAPSSVVMKYSSKVNAASAISATGYTFVKWCTQSNGSGSCYNAGAQLKAANKNPSAMTLYAIWKANTYNIVFNANGGSGSMSNLSMTYNVAKSLPANTFTKAGYTFIGWSETKTGTVKYVDKASVKNLATSGNKTLYAVWKSASEPEEDIDTTITKRLKIKNNRIILNENSTKNTILNVIGNNNNINIYENNKVISATTNIKTGNKLKTKNKEYTIIISGDTNSDGKVNGSDIIKTYSMYKGKITKTEDIELAADVNEDGKVNGSDIIKMYSMYKGKIK